MNDWNSDRVSAALDVEEMRVERLRDEAQRSRRFIERARAIRDLDAVQQRTAGTAEMIERAALRDDVASLADAQRVIKLQRTEIAALKARVQTLEQEARVDPLTGCLDRGGVDETIDQEW